MHRIIYSLYFLTLFCGYTYAQNAEIEKFLNRHREIRGELAEVDSPFTATYELSLRQPLDHRDTSAGFFEQRLVLSHRSFAAPMVMITEGYSLARRRPNLREVAEIFAANEIQVEYRYHGESLPDSLDWAYLNMAQAAADLHAIRVLLGRLYGQAWLATGFSKGGQTCLAYRYYYPEDVQCSIPYVAPLNAAQADPRIDAFFHSVGDAQTRARLHAFQRLVLSQREAMITRLQWYSLGARLRFSIGLDRALDYLVLEYPFSFWQYHQLSSDAIPDATAGPDSLLRHLRKIVRFSSYADVSLNSPSMFQFMTELGYYSYIEEHLADLLSQPGNYANAAYAPQDVDLTYNPTYNRKLTAWLAEKGERMLYIVGGNDPWGATHVQPAPERDAHLFILPNGNHLTYMRSFPVATQEQIKAIVNHWLARKP
jgi:hypothetical protein